MDEDLSLLLENELNSLDSEEDDDKYNLYNIHSTLHESDMGSFEDEMSQIMCSSKALLAMDETVKIKDTDFNTNLLVTSKFDFKESEELCRQFEISNEFMTSKLRHSANVINPIISNNNQYSGDAKNSSSHLSIEDVRPIVSDLMDLLIESVECTASLCITLKRIGDNTCSQLPTQLVLITDESQVSVLLEPIEIDDSVNVVSWDDIVLNREKETLHEYKQCQLLQQQQNHELAMWEETRERKALLEEENMRIEYRKKRRAMEKESAMREMAAIKIESAIRRWLAHKQYMTMLTKRTEEVIALEQLKNRLKLEAEEIEGKKQLQLQRDKEQMECVLMHTNDEESTAAWMATALQLYEQEQQRLAVEALAKAERAAMLAIQEELAVRYKALGCVEDIEYQDLYIDDDDDDDSYGNNSTDHFKNQGTHSIINNDPATSIIAVDSTAAVIKNLDSNEIDTVVAHINQYNKSSSNNNSSNRYSDITCYNNNLIKFEQTLELQDHWQELSNMVITTNTSTSSTAETYATTSSPLAKTSSSSSLDSSNNISSCFSNSAITTTHTSTVRPQQQQQQQQQQLVEREDIWTKTLFGCYKTCNATTSNLRPEYHQQRGSNKNSNNSGNNINSNNSSKDCDVNEVSSKYSSSSSPSSNINEVVVLPSTLQITGAPLICAARSWFIYCQLKKEQINDDIDTDSNIATTTKASNASTIVLPALLHQQQKQHRTTTTVANINTKNRTNNAPPPFCMIDLKSNPLLATEIGLKVENLTNVAFLSEFVNLNKLSLNVNAIKNFNGIGGLISLLSLSANDNMINDISALGNLKNLRYLQLNMNQLEDISALGSLTTLCSLAANNNKITGKLPVLAGCVSLQHLELSNNRITSISHNSLYALPSLTYLDLSSNNITSSTSSQSSDSSTKINVSTAANNNNNIGSALCLCPLLLTLLLADNKMTSVPSPLRLPLLKTLRLVKNQITSLDDWLPSPPPISSSTLPSSLCQNNHDSWPLFTPSLQNLFLQDNCMHSIVTAKQHDRNNNDIINSSSTIGSLLPMLSELDLSFNAITDRQQVGDLIRNCHMLRKLHIQDNLFTTAPVRNNISGEIISRTALPAQEHRLLTNWLTELRPELDNISGNDVVQPSSNNSVSVLNNCYTRQRQLIQQYIEHGNWAEQSNISSENSYQFENYYYKDVSGYDDNNSGACTSSSGVICKLIQLLKTMHTECRNASARERAMKKEVDKKEGKSATGLSNTSVAASYRIDDPTMTLKNSDQNNNNNVSSSNMNSPLSAVSDIDKVDWDHENIALLKTQHNTILQFITKHVANTTCKPTYGSNYNYDENEVLFISFQHNKNDTIGNVATATTETSSSVILSTSCLPVTIQRVSLEMCSNNNNSGSNISNNNSMFALNDNNKCFNSTSSDITTSTTTNMYPNSSSTSPPSHAQNATAAEVLLIQRFFRGHKVRRRLGNALQNIKYQDSELDDLLLLNSDDYDFEEADWDDPTPQVAMVYGDHIKKRSKPSTAIAEGGGVAAIITDTTATNQNTSYRNHHRWPTPLPVPVIKNKDNSGLSTDVNDSNYAAATDMNVSKYDFINDNNNNYNNWSRPSTSATSISSESVINSSSNSSSHNKSFYAAGNGVNAVLSFAKSTLSSRSEGGGAAVAATTIRTVESETPSLDDTNSMTTSIAAAVRTKKKSSSSTTTIVNNVRTGAFAAATTTHISGSFGGRPKTLRGAAVGGKQQRRVKPAWLKKAGSDENDEDNDEK